MKETKTNPEEKIIDQSAAERILNSMPDDEYLYDLSECFRIFGDSTRTKILSCLEISELCVDDIAACLDMTKSSVSHQLRILRQSKLVKARKSGKEVFYSLDDDHVTKIFECGLSHINE